VSGKEAVDFVLNI